MIRCTKVDFPAPAMPIVMITIGFFFCCAVLEEGASAMVVVEGQGVIVWLALGHGRGRAWPHRASASCSLPLPPSPSPPSTTAPHHTRWIQDPQYGEGERESTAHHAADTGTSSGSRPVMAHPRRTAERAQPPAATENDGNEEEHHTGGAEGAEAMVDLPPISP